MTGSDAERDVWNTALAHHQAGLITDAELAQVRRDVLDSIFARIMTDDHYQERTR